MSGQVQALDFPASDRVLTLKVHGDQVWVLTGGGKILYTYDAPSGNRKDVYELGSPAVDVCIGDRRLLLLEAGSRRVVFRSIDKPEAVDAALTLEGSETPQRAYFKGGKYFVTTSEGRLHILDEYAMASRGVRSLNAPAAEMHTDRNNRLRIRLQNKENFAEQTVDVGAGEIVEQTKEKALKRRLHTPYARSLYEREWLRSVEQDTAGQIVGQAAWGKHDTLWVDFFSGRVASLLQGQLRMFDLRTGAQLWEANDGGGREARAAGFYVRVPE